MSGFSSLIFVFFLSTMPLFFYHGFNAYADLVLGFYVLASFLYFYSWLAGQDRQSLIMAALFMGLALFVKNEALIYLIASLAVMFLQLFFNKKNIIKDTVLYSASVFVLAFPWFFYLLANNLSLSNLEENTLGWHGEVFKSFYHILFASNSWNIWWFIAITSFLLNIKKVLKNKAILFGWLYLWLVLAGFAIMYLFTEQYIYAVNFTAIGRNILALIPISVFLTGVLYQNKKAVEKTAG